MPTIEIINTETTRRCGGCTLCCKLLPTKEINKPANTKCKHQRSGKGCAIYEQRPWSCRFWVCEWLKNNDSRDLRRPDRVGYVVDCIPDYITRVNNDTGERIDIPCIQVWVDPDRPQAFRDPALLDYLQRRAMREGAVALIRRGDKPGLVLVAPAVSGQDWIEVEGGCEVAEHSFADKMRVLSNDSQTTNTSLPDSPARPDALLPDDDRRELAPQAAEGG